MKPTILSFNLTSIDITKLQLVCGNINIKIIDKSLQGNKIIDLVENANNNAINISTSFDEPLLLFANIEDNQLDGILKGLKSLEIKVNLKSVLTQFNQDWTACFLYKNLTEEREAILNKRNKN